MIGELNSQAKLTKNEVIVIRWLYANTKISHRDLAIKYECSKATITCVLNRMWWKHVEQPAHLI